VAAGGRRLNPDSQVYQFGPSSPKEWETFTSASISQLRGWLDFSDPNYVTTKTVTPGNPLAYYNMEEGGVGSTLTDRSQAGNNLDGVISNGTWNNTYKKSGTYSLEFNGTSTSVEIDELCDDMASSDWSTFMWVRTSGTGETAFKIIFAINDSSGGNRLLFSMKDGKVKPYDTDYRGYVWNQSINDGEWHHVGMVYQKGHGYGDIYKVYVDGVMDSTYQAGAVLVVASDTFTLGAEYDGGTLSDFWDGYMDDVVVFDSAITAQQVKELYNFGGTPPDLTSETITPDEVVYQVTCKITGRKWGPLSRAPRTNASLCPSWQLINGRKAAKFMRTAYLTGTMNDGGGADPSWGQPNTFVMAMEFANTGSTYQQEYTVVMDGDDPTYRETLWIIEDTLSGAGGGPGGTILQPYAGGWLTGPYLRGQYGGGDKFVTGSLDVMTVLFDAYASSLGSYITGSTNSRADNNSAGPSGLQGLYIAVHKDNPHTTYGAQRLSGNIGEILIFNKKLGQDEYLLATSYLADKWKIFKNNNIAASGSSSGLPAPGPATTFDILS